MLFLNSQKISEIMSLKIYSRNSKVTFGKFAGHTLDEIINIEYMYIIWCINHLDHFYVSEEIISQISEKYPTFVMSESLKTILEKKEKEWNIQDSFDDNERPSYGKYSGSYAQDCEGLSDDFIDDVLDGCPDAYWNID